MADLADLTDQEARDLSTVRINRNRENQKEMEDHIQYLDDRLRAKSVEILNLKGAEYGRVRPNIYRAGRYGISSLKASYLHLVNACAERTELVLDCYLTTPSLGKRRMTEGSNLVAGKSSLNVLA